MRIIKFRVWDNEQQEYLDTDILHIKNDGMLFIAEKGENPWSSLLSGGCDSERFVIEQYTGLKDKNGVKIYEGDVLIDDTGEPVEYWVVKFSDGGFVGECAGVAEPLFELTNLEVIGNIHENHKLLEEK